MPTIVITGGHKGIGLEATTTILKNGRYDVILAGRNPAEMNAVAADLSVKYTTKVQTLKLDVSSLSSVRAGVSELQTLLHNQAIEPLHALILNAGAQFMGPVVFTPDGFEKTFATNCLGHFLMLNLLLPDIQPGGRIVFTASGTHDPDTRDGKMVGRAVAPDAIRLANEGRQGKAISPGVRYSTSKLCVMLYAYGLARKLKEQGSTIQSIAFDPGLVVDTNLARTAPPAMQWFARTRFAVWLVKAMGVTMGSLAVSGAGLAKVAIDPAYDGASGKYIQSNNGKIIEARSSIASHDKALADQLWVDSETLVGLAA